MSLIFPYINGEQDSNQGLLVKNGTDKPSVFVDFSDGLLNSATTITTVSAIALDSTGTSTATVVGTTAVSGQTARIDLQTCGTGGTSAAKNNDRFKMTVTCTPSIGGPLVFPIFILIEDPAYGTS